MCRLCYVHFVVPDLARLSALTVDPFDLHHCNARCRLTLRSDSRSTLLPISTNGKLSGSIGAACSIDRGRGAERKRRGGRGGGVVVVVAVVGKRWQFFVTF